MDEDERNKRDDRNEKLKCKRDNIQGDMSKKSFGTELGTKQSRTERNEREREKHFVHWLLVAITAAAAAAAASRLCAQTHFLYVRFR